MKKSAKGFLAFLNLIGFLATVAVNALATLLPINGKGTGELSDQYPNLFVPSGLTFSIWGLIYILLGIFAVYQIVIAAKSVPGQRGLFEKINIWFFISSLLNIGWILAWHYEIVWLSLIIMVLLFISLLIIYLRLNIGKSDAPKTERFFAHIPFSVYIGWITIATIANVTALFVDSGLKVLAPGEQFWAVLVIAVGTIIGVAIMFSRNDIYYNLVVVWALVGILLKRLADTASSDMAVTIASIAGISILGLCIIIQLARKRGLYNRAAK